jgi:hypothetical protein
MGQRGSENLKIVSDLLGLVIRHRFVKNSSWKKPLSSSAYFSNPLLRWYVRVLQRCTERRRNGDSEGAKIFNVNAAVM